MSSLQEEMASDAKSGEGGQQGGKLAQLAEALLDARADLDEAKEREKEARERYDELRKKVIPDALAEEGLSSFRLPSGELVYMQGDLHVSVKKGDQHRLHEWLRQKGLEDLITEQVHYQTLRATCRELKENGEELPDFIGYFPYQKVNVRSS